MRAKIDLAPLVRQLELEFNNPELLSTALTHRSYANERMKEEKAVNNERLEFIGDAVIDLVVRDFLYEQYPDMNEGEMTSIVSRLVNNADLGKIGINIGLGNYMLMSQGELSCGGKTNPRINANALEALIGAIYKDQGMGAARLYVDHLILRYLRPLLESGNLKDSKSLLQEIIQERYGIAPAYVVMRETGPEHQRWFVIAVQLHGRTLAVGDGSSKREAEQAAANQALHIHYRVR